MKRRGASVAISFVSVLALGEPVTAAVYRWVDEAGVVNYSNDRSRYEAHRRRSDVEPDDVPPASSSSAEPSERGVAEPTHRASTEDAAAEIVRLGGVDRQCIVVSQMVQAAFGQWAWRFGRVQTGGGAVVRAFGADTLVRRVHDALLRRMDRATAGPALAWLRSPLSQRIVALEAALMTTDRGQAIAFIDALPSAPPAAARVALLHRIERAADVARNSLALRNAVGTTVQRSLGAAVRGAAQASEPIPFRPPIGEDAQRGVMLSMLLAYRELSDADLGRYASFLESPGGRWLTRVTHQALLASLAPDTPRDGPATPAAAVNALARPR